MNENAMGLERKKRPVVSPRDRRLGEKKKNQENFEIEMGKDSHTKKKRGGRERQR